MANTSALDAALFARLSADATLQTLAPGGVWRDVAPQGTATPYVVLAQVSHSDHYELGGEAYEELIVVVDAIAQGPSASGSIAAYNRIHALLQDASLAPVTGYRVLVCQRFDRIAETELDPANADRRYQHRGGTYQILAQATA